MKSYSRMIKPLFGQLAVLPKFVWILVVLAFLFGIFIRGNSSREQTIQGPIHKTEYSTNQIWTCSMHPQIKLPEPGQCPICFMDLIPLETEEGAEGPTELKMSPAAMKLAEITTARVRRDVPEAEIDLSGKIAVDETRVGKITAWESGRLEKLYVDYTGTMIKKGEPLVELYSPVLFAAQEEMLQAHKNVKNAKTSIARELAQITLDASRQKLQQLGLTDDQIEEIESRGTARDRITIKSNVSGIVIHKNAVEGLWVDRGTMIYTIADLNHIWVVLDAYESDLTWLKENQKVHFSVEAIPEKQFMGRVVFIDPILNEATRTLKVRLNVDNPKGQLKPGMFVRATVHSQIEMEADGKKPLLVPASAVLKTGKRALVYIKKPDTEEPVFEGREIRVGPRAGDDYIVIAGLDEGEEVVVKGNFKIDSAMQIAAKSSMMNPEGGITLTGHEHHDNTKKPSFTEEESSPSEIEKTETIETDETFLTALNDLYSTYFKAQAALAGDDFKGTQNALADLDQKLVALTGENLKGDAIRIWEEHRKILHDVTQHANHWSNIDAAREAFDRISRTILSLENTFGHTNQETYYEVFCPMAFDDKGASWMQNHDMVENPYFGSAMLRCGEVKKTLKPKGIKIDD